MRCNARQPSIWYGQEWGKRGGKVAKDCRKIVADTCECPVSTPPHSQRRHPFNIPSPKNEIVLVYLSKLLTPLPVSFVELVLQHEGQKTRSHNRLLPIYPSVNPVT
jgi:hypothetical protein